MFLFRIEVLQRVDHLFKNWVKELGEQVFIYINLFHSLTKSKQNIISNNDWLWGGPFLAQHSLEPISRRYALHFRFLSTWRVHTRFASATLFSPKVLRMSKSLVCKHSFTNQVLILMPFAWRRFTSNERISSPALQNVCANSMRSKAYG